MTDRDGGSPGQSIRIYNGLLAAQITTAAQNVAIVGNGLYKFTEVDLLEFADTILGIKHYQNQEAHSSMDAALRAQIVGQALLTFRQTYSSLKATDPFHRETDSMQMLNNAMIKATQQTIDALLDRSL